MNVSDSNDHTREGSPICARSLLYTHRTQFPTQGNWPGATRPIDTYLLSGRHSDDTEKPVLAACAGEIFRILEE